MGKWMQLSILPNVSSARLLRWRNYLGFLAEHNIPSQGIGSSLIQRLMNRRTRTLLPTTGNLLEPRNLNISHERDKLRDVQKRQAHSFFNTGTIMTYSCTHLKRGIRDTVRIKPYSFRGKRNGRMGWSWKDLMIERSYKVETADGSS